MKIKSDYFLQGVDCFIYKMPETCKKKKNYIKFTIIEKQNIFTF